MEVSAKRENKIDCERRCNARRVFGNEERETKERRGCVVVS